LVGASASERTFAAVASEVLDGARGRGGNDFKIPLTRRTLRAVLAEATLT
jgi:xanthine dehydrogenase YagS FAD-binding subunit